MTTALKPKFKIGQLVATPAFIKKVDPNYGMAALVQHMQGKWGMVDAEDAAGNEECLRTGGRLLSVYPLPDEGGDFWIITEADRSSTTMLLPSDY